MDTVIRNVGEMNNQDRLALEHVLGQTLQVTQQLVIQVINLQSQPESADGERANGAGLPGWCNVYEGLSDAQIAEMERTILSRADLARVIQHESVI